MACFKILTKCPKNQNHLPSGSPGTFFNTCAVDGIPLLLRAPRLRGARRRRARLARRIAPSLACNCGESVTLPDIARKRQGRSGTHRQLRPVPQKRPFLFSKDVMGFNLACCVARKQISVLYVFYRSGYVASPKSSLILSEAKKCQIVHKGHPNDAPSPPRGSHSICLFIPFR